MVREGELRAAARELGVAEVSLLDYRDGDLDRVVPVEAVRRIVQHVRRIRPQVVVTFAPDGAYGHPDHIQAHRVTTEAVAAAADRWRVPKFYWTVVSTKAFRAGIDSLIARWLRTRPMAPMTRLNSEISAFRRLRPAAVRR